jgi:hypothetical protein
VNFLHNNCTGNPSAAYEPEKMFNLTQEEEKEEEGKEKKRRTKTMREEEDEEKKKKRRKEGVEEEEEERRGQELTEHRNDSRLRIKNISLDSF